MSSKITIDNYISNNIKETTSLDTDVGPTDITLPIANSDNVAANDYILVGDPGAESGEIRQVASVTDASTIVIDPLTLHHDSGESVLVLFGNQIKIYRAANTNGYPPADGSFTELTTVNIDPDQLQTVYVDPDGNENYWYKFVYYNSTSDSATDLSDFGAARGGTASHYATNQSIREMAGFERNRNVGESLVEQFRITAQAEIDGALTGRYSIPFVAPINPYIANIARTMAAAYLRLDQFGSSDQDGKDMMTWAEAQIAKLVSGDVKLTDSIGEQTPTASDLGMSGWPNSKTVDQYGGNDFMFKRTSIDGYGGRTY